MNLVASAIQRLHLSGVYFISKLQVPRTPHQALDQNSETTKNDHNNDLFPGRCPKVGGAGARRLQNKNQAASDSDPRISTLTKPTTWHKIHKLWLRKKTWVLKYWIFIPGVLSNIFVHDVDIVHQKRSNYRTWSSTPILWFEKNILFVSFFSAFGEYVKKTINDGAKLGNPFFWDYKDNFRKMPIDGTK